MASNTGKIFEQQWKISVPSYVLLCRLPDPAQSFGGSNTLRFSKRNPFDYIMWDSLRHILYALELKTVGGKSISFERTKDSKGEIHHYQIDGLSEWNQYDGVIAGIVVEFRAIETTVFIDIEAFKRLMDIIPKNSFNMNDLDKYNIRHIIIAQQKLRTKYRYAVEDFLKTIKSNLED